MVVNETVSPYTPPHIQRLLVEKRMKQGSPLLVVFLVVGGLLSIKPAYDYLSGLSQSSDKSKASGTPHTKKSPSAASMTPKQRTAAATAPQQRPDETKTPESTKPKTQTPLRTAPSSKKRAPVPRVRKLQKLPLLPGQAPKRQTTPPPQRKAQIPARKAPVPRKQPVVRTQPAPRKRPAPKQPTLPWVRQPSKKQAPTKRPLIPSRRVLPTPRPKAPALSAKIQWLAVVFRKLQTMKTIDRLKLAQYMAEPLGLVRQYGVTLWKVSYEDGTIKLEVKFKWKKRWGMARGIVHVGWHFNYKQHLKGVVYSNSRRKYALPSIINKTEKKLFNYRLIKLHQQWRKKYKQD